MATVVTSRDKWRSPGLGDSNVRIAPIHALRRRLGLAFTLALTDRDDLTSCADGHLSQFLDWRQDERDRWPRPLRPRHRSGRSDRVTVVPDRASELAARWRVRIYHSADSRCWPMRFRGHPYVGSGNLGAPSIPRTSATWRDPRQGTSLCALTDLLAGLAANSIGSLVKGLTPLRASVAGLFTADILAKPGMTNSPASFNSL